MVKHELINASQLLPDFTSIHVNFFDFLKNDFKIKKLKITSFIQFLSQKIKSAYSNQFT
jgi:hypothetical protein